MCIFGNNLFNVRTTTNDFFVIACLFVQPTVCAAYSLLGLGINPAIKEQTNPK